MILNRKQLLTLQLGNPDTMGAKGRPWNINHRVKRVLIVDEFPTYYIGNNRVKRVLIIDEFPFII